MAPYVLLAGFLAKGSERDVDTIKPTVTSLSGRGSAARAIKPIILVYTLNMGKY